MSEQKKNDHTPTIPLHIIELIKKVNEETEKLEEKESVTCTDSHVQKRNFLRDIVEFYDEKLPEDEVKELLQNLFYGDKNDGWDKCNDYTKRAGKERCYTTAFEGELLLSRVHADEDMEVDIDSPYYKFWNDTYLKNYGAEYLDMTREDMNAAKNEVLQEHRSLKLFYANAEQKSLPKILEEHRFENIAWTMRVCAIVRAILQFGRYYSEKPELLKKEEWLEACELSQALTGPLQGWLASLEGRQDQDPDFIFEAEFLLKELQILPLVFALLIHTIHTMDEYAAMGSNTAQGQLQKQVAALREEIEALKLELEEKTARLDNLRAKAQDNTKAAIKQNTEAYHQYQSELREKDDYIDYLERQLRKQQTEELDFAIRNEHFEQDPWKDIDLPEKGVLFLGGHQNMTKKLWNKYPEWLFVTDDRLRTLDDVKYVFYWTNHGSHKMMRHVFSQLAEDTEIFYVTFTNIELLEDEMKRLYWMHKNKEETL